MSRCNSGSKLQRDLRLLGRPLAIALGVALTVTLAPSTKASEDELVAKGRRIAETGCASCHAVGRSGASPKAEAPLFRELGLKYPVEQLEETLAEGVVVGHPGMPQVKMREGEIASFIAYLKSIQVH